MRNAAVWTAALFASGCISVCGRLDPFPPHAELFDDETIPLNVVRPFLVTWYTGAPGGPQHAKELEVRCADSNACAVDVRTTVRRAFTAAQALVRGLRAGPAELVITFPDPATGEKTERRVRVIFTAPLAPSVLELGAPAPENEWELLVVRDARGVAYGCVLAREPGPGDHYRCQAGVVASPTLTHFCRDTECAEERDDDLFVCVSHGPAPHAPIDGTVLTRAGAEKETRGTPDPAQCR